MLYKVLLTILALIVTVNLEAYDSLYPPTYNGPYDPVFRVIEAFKEQFKAYDEFERDRPKEVLKPRYPNEVTALPETDGPDVHVIDIEPIHPYENLEVIIIE